ncbi:MAG: hypothetical protein IT270_00215, partial [Saprospiraceae bacterium]|nr:hypothetical protein [Saprospiraceae bacterium]
MKKHPLLTIMACLLLQQTAMAQTPMFSWANAMQGANPSDPSTAEITDLDTDPAGNTYITGEYRNDLHLGGTVLTGNNNAAFFLAKYSPDGVLLWAKKVVQAQPEDGLDFNSFAQISTDDAGNVYWSGNYEAASLDFGNGTTITRTCTNGCQEGFLVKTDAAGTIVFAKALHASGGEDFTIAGVAAANSGVHVVSGSFKGTELWLQGGANIGGIADDGYFTALYNAAGGAEWIAFLNPNSGIPNVTGIAMSDDGERIAVVGNYSDSLLNFGNSAVTASFSNNKRFAVWYNKVGQPMGAGTLSSTVNVDIYDIRLDDTYKLWT